MFSTRRFIVKVLYEVRSTRSGTDLDQKEKISRTSLTGMKGKLRLRYERKVCALKGELERNERERRQEKKDTSHVYKRRKRQRRDHDKLLFVFFILHETGRYRIDVVCLTKTLRKALTFLYIICPLFFTISPTSLTRKYVDVVCSKMKVHHQ